MLFYLFILSIVEAFLLCSFCQGPTEKEQIDVQGDISYDIVEFITDTWPDVSYPSSLHFIMVYIFYLLSCMPVF
jgi:hypothetical protein